MTRRISHPQDVLRGRQRSRKIEFVDYMRSLNIVPVSINTSWIHRQTKGAQALRSRSAAATGRAVRDIESIVAGIVGGQKGGYISPSRPIPGASSDPDGWQRRSSTKAIWAAIASSGNYLAADGAQQGQHHRSRAPS